MTDLIYSCRVLKSRGLRGELKVETEDDRKDRFRPGMKMFSEDGRMLTLSSFSQKGRISFLKFEEIKDLNQAESFRAMKIYIDEKDLPESSEGLYYVKDLIGSKVFENDKLIGDLIDVHSLSKHDLFEIRSLKGQNFYLPAVKAFIKSIDKQNKLIRVNLIEGMLDTDKEGPDCEKREACDEN